MTIDEAIEKAARALYSRQPIRGLDWDDLEPHFSAAKRSCLEDADAALAALPLSVEQLEQIAKGEARITANPRVTVERG